MAERTLHTPLTDLPGVGPARRGPWISWACPQWRTCWPIFPGSMRTARCGKALPGFRADTPVCFAAVVAEPFRTSYIRKGMELTKGRIVDGTGQAAGYIF